MYAVVIPIHSVISTVYGSVVLERKRLYESKVEIMCDDRHYCLIDDVMRMRR